MLTLAYLIYTLLFILMVVMFIKESSALDKLIREEKKYVVPIFNFGKKQNAFTIEETETVITTAAFKMPFLRRLYCKVVGYFFDVSKFYLWSKDFASRLAIRNLQGLSKDYDYYVNYKVNIIQQPGGYFIAEVTATALKLYKDTLGLFQVPSDIFKFKPSLKRMHLVRNLFRNIVMMGLILVAMMFSFKYYATHLINNISYDDEKLIWSVMKESNIIKEREENPSLQDGEEKVNGILSKITFSEKLANYNFEVLIIDDSDPDLHLLPAGKIVITKGLLKMVSSEQEMMFIILDAIGHYENQSHLKVIGQNIITPYFIMRWFGPDNILSRWAFHNAGFYKQVFSADSELQTNDFAFIQLDRIYKDIGSIDIFAENIIHEESTYIKTHPITKENLKMLKVAHHLEEGDLIPLELNLDAPVINIVSRPTNDPEVFKIFSDVEEGLNDVYINYNNAIKPLLDVLEPRGLSSKEGIDGKMEVVDYGFDVVEFFEDKLTKTLDETNKNIDEHFSKEDDQDQARFDRITLLESVDDFENIMHFYFNRDLSIMKLQKNILNFLKARIGTYEIKKGKFIFKSQYEQENFNKLIQKVHELTKQKPKFKTDKWRNYG